MSNRIRRILLIPSKNSSAETVNCGMSPPTHAKEGGSPRNVLGVFASWREKTQILSLEAQGIRLTRNPNGVN